jgi:hypothetical protein
LILFFLIINRSLKLKREQTQFKKMKRILLFASALIIGTNGISQVADFETTLSQTDTAWFGQDQDLKNTMLFENGDFEFENTYTIATWGVYSQGWAYSNITDNTTTGSFNDKSSFTGGGATLSDQYGVCNTNDNVDHRTFLNTGLAFTPTEVVVSNATYTALSMQNGDMFAKQFGSIYNAAGEIDGTNGEDSLVLTIIGLDEDNLPTGNEVEFFLADFRNGSTTIINTWETVDLTSLGTVFGLDFTLTSSDNGDWGMNTPQYFVMDNLKATGVTDGDFETTTLTAESAWYGQDQTLTLASTFTSGFYNFENIYNDGQWGAYSQGWSYSNYTDITTAGSDNQYSAITGAGESSDQYAICNASPYVENRVFASSQTAFTPTGAFFTNSTYATLSMETGDGLGAEYGDITNASSGEDWFLLTIYGLNADSTQTGDSVNFYLADYRFSDNTEDYIVKEWTWVDLTSLEDVYGLDFVLTSSDTNAYGLLTPEYFAMDKLGATVAGIENNQQMQITAYPNPTSHSLNINTSNGELIQLFDLNGRIVYNTIATESFTSLNISHLDNGIYVLYTQKDGVTTSQKIVKK